MADNRYSVDDILKELNENKQRSFSSAPTPPPVAPPPQERRRPTSTPDTSVQERRKTSAPPPQERYREATPPPAEEDDFWEMKKPAPRRTPTEQRPSREQPWEQPAQPHRPMREPPAGASSNPRLGQTIPPPRNREEMGKLLGRFDDNKQDPLGNLDFLEREPSMDYNDTAVQSFVPDWDKPTTDRRPGREPSLQQGGRQAREATQQQRPYREEAAQQPSRLYRDDIAAQQRSLRDDPSSQQPRSFREDRAIQQSRSQQGGRREIPNMYGTEERRSMAGAARLITSGGFDEEGDYDTRQTARAPQQPPARQPAPRQQAPYRDTPRTVPQAPQATRPTGPIPTTGRQPTAQIPPLPDELDIDRYEPRMDPRPEAGEQQRTPAPAAQRPKGERQSAKRESNQQVAAQMNSMKVSLFIRVAVNLLALVGVVYLALAGPQELPLPSFIAGEENIGILLWSAVVMVIVSALVSGNTIGGGILSLLKLRPGNDAYSAIAVFACLIQGSYMAMQPHLMADFGDNLYLPMAALMLLFNTLGKLILLSRMAGSFRLASAKGDRHVADIMDNREFARRISGDIVGEEPRIAYFTEAAMVEGFLDQAFSESKAEDISKIAAPVTALAALVMALISYLLNRDIFVSACVYTAALCITAPLAGVIASNLPLSITNGKLARFGASLCGYDAVNLFSGTNGVLLRCSQLFPRGSVTIQDIKVLDRRPIDQVIIDAASVLCACDSNLSGIFREMVQDSSMLHQPENLEYYDDMGLSAWVNGRRVLIGNRALMMSYGVTIPGVEFERPYTTGHNEVLYLANSGEAAAMYVLAYKADKQMRRAMELLCDRDMAVCVYSTDPNLTAEKISSIYSFPKELLSIIPASMQVGSEKYLAPKGKIKAAVVHNGTPASYLRTILAAQSCSRCITLETALMIMSIIIGFAIVTFFAFTGQMATLTWVTIAVYQFFWLLIELVIPLVKH